MDYAARLPRPPTRTMVVPVVALLVGAAVATATYALIDSGDDAIQAATKVIVVDTPAQHSADIPGKNEAASAAAISPMPSVSTTDEATTAAAIAPTADTAVIAPTADTAPRGSKASATDQPGTDAPTAAEEQRADPHGTAASLRNP
jgi:hypothetical protein